MELEEFIKSTLVSIKKGLHEANLELAKQEHKTLGQDFTAPFIMTHNDGDRSYITFDVAVTVSRESEKSGGGGIKIAVVNLGGDASLLAAEKNVSRIKFYILSGVRGG